MSTRKHDIENGYTHVHVHVASYVVAQKVSYSLMYSMKQLGIKFTCAVYINSRVELELYLSKLASSPGYSQHFSCLSACNIEKVGAA